MLSDFPSGITDEVAHRPWPMPDAPWIMTQSWHDLLFAHWPVGADALRARVPPGLELDLFDGQAWLGIVPFRMTNVAPRAVPALPWVSAFAELNVRTYVRVGSRPGVYFFSLDASNPVAVLVARTMFNLPYYTASTDVTNERETVRYASRREASGGVRADFTASYRAVGPVFTAQPGSLDYFLTERYCLYTVNDAFELRRLEIHHPPWPLQAAEATIEQNTMADAAGIRLPSMAPRLHFAKRQDMVAWAPAAIDGR
jgi:uncharacterized protein YqjF (DUF2071 family)